jgi:serine/threonine-protein kinase
MDTIGKYQLIRVIGEGGMGRVYEAIDPVIGRRVAIKTISLDVDDADTRARFFREAQSAGQLSHPNLITIHDIGEVGGMPYIVMEYLEGMDLNRTMRRNVSRTTRKSRSCSRCAKDCRSRTGTTSSIGTSSRQTFPDRTGPDQDSGLRPGARRRVRGDADRQGSRHPELHVAGTDPRGRCRSSRRHFFGRVVFYELLTGRKPFEGDSIATTMYKVLETEPPPLHLVDAHLPLTLSSVINRALAKDRSVRFQTSGEMLDAISQGTACRRTSIRRGSTPSPHRRCPPFPNRPAPAAAAR